MNRHLSIYFTVLVVFVSGCSKPANDMDRFAMSFKKKTDFEAFTNAALFILTRKTPEDRLTATKELEAALPSLTAVPPRVGVGETKKNVRVIYFDGMVTYEIVVLIPGEKLSSYESDSTPSKRIAENVYILRLNH